MNRIEGMFEHCTRVEEAVMVALGAASVCPPTAAGVDALQAMAAELTRWLQGRGIDDDPTEDPPVGVR